MAIELVHCEVDSPSKSIQSMEMETEIKFFAKVQCYLTILGIKPIPDSSLKPVLQKNQLTINTVHISCMFITFVYYGCSVLGFAFSEAVFFIEYAEAAFYFAAAVLHLVSYAILIWVRGKLFALIQDAEGIVAESAWKIFYKPNLYYR